jgi:membrane protein YdbS with pleckstrin-like domain
MKNNDLNRLIIRISAFVFLLLGMAVVFVIYWFRDKNKASQSLAGVLFILCITLFIVVIFFFLNKKYQFLTNKKKEK